MNPTNGHQEVRDLLAFSGADNVISSPGNDLGGLFCYQILHLEILQCTFPFLDKLKFRILKRVCIHVCPCCVHSSEAQIIHLW